MALSACLPASGTPTGPAAEPKSQATISVGPAGSRDWRPDRPVVVRASLGTLASVAVRDAKGHAVKGALNASATRWRSTVPVLAFGTKFTVRATAVDEAGLRTKSDARFRTLKPRHNLALYVSPLGGTTVGTGMPIIVSFSEPVTHEARVEQLLSVKTSRPVKGGWYWVTNQQVRYRPEHPWPAETNVDFHAALAGVEVAKGTWGTADTDVSFRVGSSTVSTVNIAKHTLTVYQDGKVTRVIPVTTGMPGFDTRNGIKVIISKEPWKQMDAATIDIPKSSPNYYNLNVQWAMRVTWTGEFLHAAPWSVASQGIANVSHGCTGMSTANAAWYYSVSKIGDMVTYVGGHRALEPWNGYTDWNMSWADWKAGSALS
jgi:lipoprotein-anchoring transpeptidase ErfK/SrfK